MELVGIEDVTSSEGSAEAEDTQYAHRRDDAGQPINVVVVRRRDTRVPKGRGMVDLTTGEVRDPIVIVDISAWRSVMENGMFKRARIPGTSCAFPRARRQR
jgi:hypothetical protein